MLAMCLGVHWCPAGGNRTLQYGWSWFRSDCLRLSGTQDHALQPPGAAERPPRCMCLPGALREATVTVVSVSYGSQACLGAPWEATGVWLAVGSRRQEKNHGPV